ncbi:hypothetical protein ZONE111905_08275 [Zobellia nedashkovskayae]
MALREKWHLTKEKEVKSVSRYQKKRVDPLLMDPPFYMKNSYFIALALPSYCLPQQLRKLVRV